MKFFIDTADIEAIQSLLPTGLIDGVTTNPSLIARTGLQFEDIISKICGLVKGPVSAEVTACKGEDMLKEGRSLAKISPNVIIKVPLTPEGLKACYALNQEGIPVNVTLCFSATQAILAAKAGATFVSPFVGRLEDLGEAGINLIRQIVAIYKNYPDFKTQVLAASIRSPLHVAKAALAGANVATLPPKTFWQLYEHPLTEKGLEAFTADWEKATQKTCQ